MLSSPLERMLLPWFGSLGSLSVTLIELSPADRARVVILKPGFDAAAVEGVIARQLAACLAILALFQANVAVSLFAFLFLRQVLDEVGGAALALRLLILSDAAKEGAKWALLREYIAHEILISSTKEAVNTFVLIAKNLVHERMGSGLRCSL